MSIITYPLNGVTYSAEDVEIYHSTRTSGVFSSEISVSIENRNLTISPFLAWIKNSEFSGKSVAVTSPETVTIEASEAVLDRIDRIVLRYDKNANNASISILKGEGSKFPVAPTISRTEFIYDLVICDVYIPSGSLSISGADVTMQILNEELCGIMRDGVTGIPTAQLQTQAEDLIEKLDTAIKEVEANSAFMMSDVYDPEKKAKPVAFADEIKEIMYPVGSIIQTRGVPAASGLPGKWEVVSSKNSIPLKRHISVPEANTVYKEVFDVSEYKILRNSYNIVALPKSTTPEEVSLSFGEITSDFLGDFEYVKTFELYIHRKTAHSTWVHILFSGESILGFDWHYKEDASGGAVLNWERIE